MFNQRARVGSLAVSLCLLASARADQPPAKPATPVEKGQHVLIIGNSFQNFVDHHLAVTATTAGIKGHLRGGDPLAAVKVDVVASNPWFRIHDKADKGLDDLVEKALKHNPDIRVLAQVGWLPYDDPVFPMPEKGREKTNWNVRATKDVRAIHAAYLKNAEDQVQALNKRLGKQVVFIVPVAHAVIALREKVAAGEVPGLKTQDDLFGNSIGHAKPPVELLNAYCHFAVVYRRSPVGLTPTGAKDEKLHHLLQEIAWDAVLKEPLSGVKPQEGRKPADAGAAIDRGLAFLVKDALAWKSEHKCASCHHAALVIWSMREARQRGHTVDEPVLAELTKWVAESGDGKFSMARPASAPKAASPKAIYFALALGVDPKPDAVSQKGLKLLLKTVASEQTENGSWSTWPETRPPIFGRSDETLTLLATLATLPAATGDDSVKAVRDRAVKWLADTRTDDDPQSIALRLVLWNRLDRPAKEWQPLVQRIKDRQNADGGWSQTKDMASDAYATGQALYALAHAGIKPDESVIKRGQGFLIQTQRDDGSWPMTSRPTKTGGKGSTSLIPITGAGSAWAVLGLVRSR